ncbi:MAG TPA: PilZ domain-containing protein [Blastocatellia bacterium]|nr:PilZ domain-containing protein [Blastocatellia bacterium]
MSDKTASILIATHDEPLGWLLAECLRLYYRCETADAAGDAARVLMARSFNLVIVEIDAGAPSQLELCRLITGVYPQTRLLMILEEDCLQDAIKLVARRRFEYLVKPIDVSQVLRSTRRALWAQAHMAARPSRLTSLGEAVASGFHGVDSPVRAPDTARGDETSSSVRTSSDRRKDERVAYLCEVQCESANDRRFTTRINDISVGGAFIDSMIPLRVGSILKLIFRVRAAEITAMGEVRYSMPRIGMGIRFVDLNPEYGAAIASVVGENSHRGPVPNGGDWQSSSR